MRNFILSLVEGGMLVYAFLFACISLLLSVSFFIRYAALSEIVIILFALLTVLIKRNLTKLEIKNKEWAIYFILAMAFWNLLLAEPLYNLSTTPTSGKALLNMDLSIMGGYFIFWLIPLLLVFGSTYIYTELASYHRRKGYHHNWTIFFTVLIMGLIFLAFLYFNNNFLQIKDVPPGPWRFIAFIKQLDLTRIVFLGPTLLILARFLISVKTHPLVRKLANLDTDV